MHLTRLAVGLIFLVSTFFSDVNLLTDSWAIFNLKLKEGVGRGEEEEKEEKEEKREEKRKEKKEKARLNRNPNEAELTNQHFGNERNDFHAFHD